MIEIITPKDLPERIERARKKIDDACIKGRRSAVRAGVKFAQGVAPVKSGYLQKHITATNYKHKSVIQSFAVNKETDFPYNMWVNEDIEKVILAGKKRSYRSTRHTGMPGYFREMAKILAERYPKIIGLEITRALRASFGGK